MARRLFQPDVERFIIPDVGEVIIDEVRKHWMAVAFPIVRAFFAGVLILGSMAWQNPYAWILAVLGVGIGLQAGYRILEAHLDRFVITNIRVFRVHGVFVQHVATMPMTRILDIAIRVPIVGRIFGFGHFQFESAAQSQGLRDITYVGQPYERDLTIQRAVQRSGARGNPMRPTDMQSTAPLPPFDRR